MHVVIKEHGQSQTGSLDNTCMLVRRVSIDDKPSGKRNGDGKPGGRACPASDNLS